MKNVTSSIIKGIGSACIVIGILVALILRERFGLTIVFSCVLSGILLVGFGEIIQLLQDIKDKIK